MNPELVKAFARRLRTDVRAATEAERSILTQAGVPDSVSSVLSPHWFGSYSDIDGVEIYDLASICEEVRDSTFKQLPAAGFLPIGKAGNGDTLAISFSDPNLPVGYVRLGQESQAAQAFVKISKSLDKFLERGGTRPSIKELFLRRPRFPQDYYDAKDKEAEL